MTQTISTITAGLTNCYLVPTNQGYILIDTGAARHRAQLDAGLARAGCQPGDLKVIILTHGDADHVGNCAYLRQKHGAKIAMHYDDAGMVEHGDMGWNRNGRISLMGILKVFFRCPSAVGLLPKSERFKADLYFDDGQELNEYGLDAQIVHIPGHSAGSIGVLTRDGDLYCGDLLTNLDRPVLSEIYTEQPHADASLNKVKRLGVKTIYPAHGKPFPFDQFLESYELSSE